MPRSGKVIPLLPLKRMILEKNDIRISKDALIILSDYLENYAITISKKAVNYSIDDGRKTIKAVDIIKYLEQ